MQILPTGLGTRPRLAVELRPEGVVAALATDAAAMLSAVSRVELNDGAVAPGLRVGNVVDRVTVISSVRTALDAVSGHRKDRARNVTVVVPDAAVRVLLLEFDELPAKVADALPVVRFRLKKMLPFDADSAAVSYQVMASAKGSTQVLVVAMPKDVLEEYEGIVTAAGYAPGAVLPSTLAALAGLEVSEDAALLVNAGRGGVTTAIVKGGVLLLHRSLDMTVDVVNEAETSGSKRTGEYDRLDAETAMQASVLQIAETREFVGEATAIEVMQTVSVAAAYFEDTLGRAPETILSAGTLGAERLAAIVEEGGIEGQRVREVVDAAMLEAGAATATVPRCWLGGVRGALKG